MKAVLDANVIVSFLLTAGVTNLAIFEYWDKGKFKLLISNEIFEEYEEIITELIEMKRVTRSQGGRFLRKVKRKSIRIHVIHTLKLSKDKKDNRYINCALDGKANYLVTKDKEHLLPLFRYKYTLITNPQQFLRILKETYLLN